jgi:hypothetical protein
LDRRRFEHLFVELSMACGRLVPRFRLWLHLREDGADPEALCQGDALAFCDEGIVSFLAAEKLSISRWQHRRLRRAVATFDPELTTPAEILSRVEGERI